MAQRFEFQQSSHLNPALTDPASRALNVDKLIGRWVNTNPESRGLSRFVIEHDDQRFRVGATGVGADGPIDWPLTEADVLANLEEEEGQRAVALAATFEFGFMATRTQIRVNKGILVVVLFTEFRDNSGRSNFVTREFFYRVD